MITLDEARKRVSELQVAVDQSASRHNLLCGRLHEAGENLAYLEAKTKELADEAAKPKSKAKAPVKAVKPVAAPTPINKKAVAKKTEKAEAVA